MLSGNLPFNFTAFQFSQFTFIINLLESSTFLSFILLQHNTRSTTDPQIPHDPLTTRVFYHLHEDVLLSGELVGSLVRYAQCDFPKSTNERKETGRDVSR